jgi:hypothetical protein
MPSCGPLTGWCARVRPGEPYTRDQCQRCWLMTHSANHRRNWGVAGPAVEVRKPPRPARAKPPAAVCPHLGEPTGRDVECASCKRAKPVTMPVYRCGLHGLTVLGDRRPKSQTVTACRWCPDRPRPE